MLQDTLLAYFTLQRLQRLYFFVNVAPFTEVFNRYYCLEFSVMNLRRKQALWLTTLSGVKYDSIYLIFLEKQFALAAKYELLTKITFFVKTDATVAYPWSGTSGHMPTHRKPVPPM